MFPVIEFEDIPSERIVPGDIIEITASKKTGVMTCDAVMLSGTCIMNEAMLTGESVPMTKSALSRSPDSIYDIYDIEAHKRNTLFNGTRVLQTRSYEGGKVLAIVVRTGMLLIL